MKGEVWYILYCILKGLSFLKKNGLSNGNIQLKNIFVGKNNRYKICDHILFGEDPPFLKMVRNKPIKKKVSEAIYLSPQQMSQIEEGDDIVEYDISKADLFTLAVNMIHILNGEKMDKYYDY